MDCHLFQLAKQNIHLHIYWQENQLVLSHSPFPDFHIHYSVKLEFSYAPVLFYNHSVDNILHYL